MYECGVSFKSVRHLQEYGRFHFYSRYVLVFNKDEKSWVHIVSQNLNVESLNQFNIF